MRALFACALAVLSFPAAARDMGPVTVNGLHLSGAEFWPFVGDVAFDYPADVEWGFEAGSDAARACAQRSFDRLVAFMTENPAKMRRAAALGATRNFYLWTNDYTRASPDRERRRNRMWHWNGGETEDHRLGFWKWEATLTQAGECLVPEAASIDAALDAAIAALDD